MSAEGQNQGNDDVVRKFKEENVSKKFGGWLKSHASVIGEHFQEIRENTKLMAAEIADKSEKELDKARRAGQKLQVMAQTGISNLARGEERIDVVFDQGELGLELDLRSGAVVRAVVPGGQAEHLKVRAKDRLIAVGAEVLPPPEDEHFKESIRRCMKQPRPVTFTFVRSREAGAAPATGEAPLPRVRQPDAKPQAGLKNFDDLLAAAEASPPEKVEVPTVGPAERLMRYEAEAQSASAAAEEARTQAAEAREEAVALKADLADLELSQVWAAQEAQKSAAEAEEARQAAAASEHEIQRLTSELERVSAEQKEAEQAEVARLQAALERAELREASTEARVAELTEEVHSEEKQRQRLQAAVMAAEGKFANYEEQLRASQGSAIAAEGKAANFEEQLRASQGSAIAAEGKAANFEEQLRASQDSAIAAASKAADLEEQLRVAQAKGDEASGAVSALESKLSELEKKKADLQADLAAQSRELTDSAAALEAAQTAAAAAAAAADAKLAKLEKQSADLESDLALQRGKAADSASALDAAESSGASQLAAAQAKLVELGKRCADLESELETQKSKAAEDASVATAAHEEIQRGKVAAAAAAQETITGLEEQLKNLKSASTQDLESQSARAAAAEAKARALEEEQSARAAAAEAKARALEEEQSARAAAAEAKASALEQELGHLRTSNSEAVQSGAKAAAQLKSAEGSIAELMARVEQLQADVRRSEGSAGEQVAELTRQLESLRGELQASAAGARAAEDRAEQWEATAAEERRRVEALQEARQRLSEEEESSAEARCEVERLQQALKAAEARAGQLQGDIERLQTECQAAERESRVASEKSSQLTQQLAHSERESRVALETSSQLTQQLAQLECARVELEEKLASERQAREDLQSQSALAAAAEAKARALEEELGHLRTSNSEEAPEVAAGAVKTAGAQSEEAGSTKNGEHAEEADCDADENAPLLATQIGKPVKEADKPADSAARNQRLKELQARVAELEVQNSALSRRLDARPIVYQFGPTGDEEMEEEADLAVEAVESAGELGGDNGRIHWGTAALSGAKWCKRKLCRGIRACRKQTIVKSVERPLRAFTKSLLSRPLLMWLFYAQLLMLWVVEIWRQAFSRPLAQDPAIRIENRVQAVQTR